MAYERGGGGAERIDIAIDKLHDEAKRWFDAADELDNAINKVKTLQCSEAAFSFLDLGVDLAGAYEEARKDFKKLAAEGEDTLNQIGKALKTAANQFEAEDNAGKHRVENSVEWSVRD